MPIDNPQAIVFVQDYARPIAEKFMQLQALLDEAEAEWTASDVQPFFTGVNLGENVEDQNGTQHPITGRDVVDWALMVAAIRTTLNTLNAMGSIQRLSVRPLRV